MRETKYGHGVRIDMDIPKNSWLEMVITNLIYILLTESHLVT